MKRIKRRLYHRSVRRAHFRHQRQCLRRHRHGPEDPAVITQVLGAEHGIKGVLNDRLFDMGQEDPRGAATAAIHPLLRPGLLPL